MFSKNEDVVWICLKVGVEFGLEIGSDKSLHSK